MSECWRRVARDSNISELGGATIIRIMRGPNGDTERMEWFEPDRHVYTGYADIMQDRRRPAAEVLVEHKEMMAVVAIEDETLWDAA